MSQKVLEFKGWQKINKKKSFGILLNEILEEREIRPSTFYKKAWLDRRIYWNIMNLPGYQPSKETVVACVISLELDEVQAEQFMNSAGYALSMSITWDAVILYCISRKCYDLFKINDLLNEVGEKGLCVR